MSKASRAKGCRGELEVLKVFHDHYDAALEMKRQLNQWQDSDCDLRRWGFAFEIKRQETLNLRSWWNQACENAGDDIPAVIYRQSRQPWRIMVTPWAINPLYHFSDGTNADPEDFDYAVTMLLWPAFIDIMQMRDEFANSEFIIGTPKKEVASQSH